MSWKYDTRTLRVLAISLLFLLKTEGAPTHATTTSDIEVNHEYTNINSMKQVVAFCQQNPADKVCGNSCAMYGPDDQRCKDPCFKENYDPKCDVKSYCNNPKTRNLPYCDLDYCNRNPDDPYQCINWACIDVSTNDPQYAECFPDRAGTVEIMGSQEPRQSIINEAVKTDTTPENTEVNNAVPDVQTVEQAVEFCRQFPADQRCGNACAKYGLADPRCKDPCFKDIFEPKCDIDSYCKNPATRNEPFCADDFCEQVPNDPYRCINWACIDVTQDDPQYNECYPDQVGNVDVTDLQLQDFNSVTIPATTFAPTLESVPNIMDLQITTQNFVLPISPTLFQPTFTQNIDISTTVAPTFTSIPTMIDLPITTQNVILNTDETNPLPISPTSFQPTLNQNNEVPPTILDNDAIISNILNELNSVNNNINPTIGGNEGNIPQSNMGENEGDILQPNMGGNEGDIIQPNMSGNEGDIIQPNMGGNEGDIIQPTMGGNEGDIIQPNMGGNEGDIIQPTMGGTEGDIFQPIIDGNDGNILQTSISIDDNFVGFEPTETTLANNPIIIPSNINNLDLSTGLSKFESTRIIDQPDIPIMNTKTEPVPIKPIVTTQSETPTGHMTNDLVGYTTTAHSTALQNTKVNNNEEKVSSAGYEEKVYDREGYDQFGYDRDGYNRRGYDTDGYDRQGYNEFGYDASGYDNEGYAQEGYDQEGYDREGYNREGYDHAGYDREGYDKEGYDDSYCDRAGFCLDDVYVW